MKRAPRLPSAMYWTGSKEIYGYPSSREALQRIAKHLDARNAILVLSRASLILERWGDTSREGQLLLAKCFLRGQPLKRAITLLSDPDQALFFRPQFYALMNYLARYGWSENPQRLIGEDEFEQLGSALFAVCDAISSEDRKRRRDLNPTDLLSSVAFELVLNSYFTRFPDLSLSIARAKYLYVNIHRRLALKPPLHFLDIEAIFREATSIGLDEYLSIGMAVLAHFHKYVDNDKPLPPEDNPTIIFPGQVFAKAVLDKGILRRAFSLASVTLEDFRAQVSSHTNREMVYDFLAIKAHPLLRRDDEAFLLLSFPYLFERLTTGIYWIIFDYLGTQGGNLHLQFSRYVGRIFQTYVEELVEQIHLRQGNGDERLLRDQPYETKLGERRTPDVMVFGKDYAIIIEASATRIQAKKTTSQGIPEAFQADCEKMIFDNVRSLENFINDFRTGVCTLEGIDASAIRTIYPIIVLIEELPQFWVIDDYIAREIQTKGFLSDKGIAPLSILDIDDLESLEKWSRAPLLDAIRDWHRSPYFPHEAFRDHVMSTLVEEQHPVRGSWIERTAHRNFAEAGQILFGHELDLLTTTNQEALQE